MDWKKLGKALLFPHIAIMILLVPIATVLLVGSMVFIGIIYDRIRNKKTETRKIRG